LSKLKDEGVIKGSTLSDKPELLPDAVWVWNAFNMLASQRQAGPHGPQPLTLSDIYACGALLAIESSDLEDFTDLITLMDREYIEHRYKKIDAERRKAEQKAKGKRSK